MASHISAKKVNQLEQTVVTLTDAMVKTEALCEDLKRQLIKSAPLSAVPVITADSEGNETELEKLIARIVRRGMAPLATAISNLAENMSASAADHNKLNWRREQRYYPEPVLEGLVLKNDHFANCHRLKAPPMFEGVFNFRQVEGLPVFGVNQTIRPGIENIVHYLLDQADLHHVVWVNLREEPVIFIRDMPFSPREPKNLNTNVDYLLSIEGYEIECMESRLKLDVLDAAERQGGTFKAFHQNEAMENEQITLEIAPYSVKTLREVYTGLKHRGSDVVYARIPIQDECAPEEKDIVELVTLIYEHHQNLSTAFVFNCQMGRGRTTTGMVICTMMLQALRSHHKQLCSGSTDNISNRRLSRRLSKSAQSLSSSSLTRPTKTPENYKNGEWAVIMELMNTLEDGYQIKEAVDRAIDQCAALQNLREAIYECKQKADNPPERPKNAPLPIKQNEHSDDPDDTYSSSFWYRRGLHYLERYFYLILIGEYINMNARKGFKEPFDLWMRQRWGLKRMLKKMRLE